MDNNYNNNFDSSVNCGSSNPDAYNRTAYNTQATSGQAGYAGQNTSGQTAYNTGAGQNAYTQAGYNAGAGTAQTGYGQTYNAGGYQQGNAYNPYQQAGAKPPKKQRPPKQKKNGFGVKLAKCAAIALVFGLVGGGVFTGVSYVGGNALGIVDSTDRDKNSSKDSEDSKDSSIDNSGTVQQTATGLATHLTDVSSIVEEVMPSIVAITNTGTITYQTFWGAQEYQSESCGSGIIIGQDDDYLYIVSNNHVVENAESLTVQFCDSTTVSCEIKGTDAADDLAVVKVEIDSIEPDTLDTIKVATVGDSDSLKVGNPAIAIGNALGYGQSVSCGYISALGRTVTIQDETTGQTIVNNNMIQTDAAINPGNSGGALLNANGEVIGINSSKYSDTSVEGVGYAIPMSDATPIIEQLITREKVDEAKGAYLGIQGQDISEDVASAYNMPEGVYVYQVIPGSAAEEAGIRQGDIITAFDGQSVSTMSDLKELMTYYEADQKVKVTLQRLGNGYEEQEITVTLGSASSAQKSR